jgi:hypothetical protein
MNQNLYDIQVNYDEPISIFFDNISAISISNNLVMHSKMKQISLFIAQVVGWENPELTTKMVTT